MSSTSRWVKTVTVMAGVLVLLLQHPLQSQGAPFQVIEATIEDVHDAYKSQRLTARQLVQRYLDRIDAYDRKGPAINSVINVNPKALEEADRLDAAMKSGLVGPLHGIPILLKDMIDVAGMPTTNGSAIMKNFVPTRDAFVVDNLKKAGAIVLAKVTLGQVPDSYTKFVDRDGLKGARIGILREPMGYFSEPQSEDFKTVTDNRLDAIVHKTVEHTPTLLRDYTNPPYSNMKGTTHLSTFLGPIATISVPAGFTPAGLPVGIMFFGRAFSEAALIKLAYAYEQSTHHRTPPKTTPALAAR